MSSSEIFLKPETGAIIVRKSITFDPLNKMVKQMINLFFLIKMSGSKEIQWLQSPIAERTFFG